MDLVNKPSTECLLVDAHTYSCVGFLAKVSGQVNNGAAACQSAGALDVHKHVFGLKHLGRQQVGHGRWIVHAEALLLIVDAIVEQQLDQHVAALAEVLDVLDVLRHHASGVAHLKANHGHVNAGCKDNLCRLGINAHVELGHDAKVSAG